MSDYVITSTSDSEEEVLAAMGGTKSKEEQEEQQGTIKLGEQSEEKEEGTEGHEGQPKKKGGFQKRIDKLTREKNDLEARLSRLEAAQPKKEEGKTETGAPDPLFFETQADYLAALVKYTVTQTKKEELEETKNEVAKKEVEVRTESWTDRVAAAHEAHPDLNDLLEEDLPVSPAVNEILIESEIGGELLYWLASNPKECSRISHLGPLAAAKAMGVIEDRLLAALPKEQTEKKAEEPEIKVKVTAAKKPIIPVSGGKGSTGSKSPDDMSLEEYRKWRDSQS